MRESECQKICARSASLQDSRNPFLDPLLFQIGTIFRASDALATSFTYERHEFLVFSIEIGF